MGLLGSGSIVGLDIGSANLKAVQFQTAGTKVSLHNAMLLPTPSESFADGNIVLPDVIAASLAASWGKYFSSRSVVLTLPPQQVILKQIWVKAPPGASLDELVKWEMEKFLPLPVEEMFIQYQFLQEKEENVQVLAAAAPRHIIDSLVRLCKLAKLTPVAIEVPYLALLRLLFATSNDLAGSTTTFMIEMGANQTQILFLANSALYLVRAIPIAGGSFTQAIAKSLGLPIEEAEKLKRTKATLVADEAQFEPFNLIYKSMGPVLKELVQELERSVDYFQSRANIYQEMKILLSGGGAALRGMDGYLKEVLGVEVSYWAPVSRYLAGERTQIPELLPVINLPAGLALHGEERHFPPLTFENMEAALLV